MSLRKTIKLNNGTHIPQIGLGTWLSGIGEVESAVQWAVEAGYRHIDCARIYHNQHEVGAALRRVVPSIVKREELFITSKLWNNAHHPDDVERALDETLEQLGLEYLDLYLIHWPVAFRPGAELVPLRTDIRAADIAYDLPLADTWRAVAALRGTGKVRAVGVSNFTVSQLQAIIDATGVVPAVNQVEAHPLLPQDELVRFCEEKGIHLTAYSPLGNNLRGETKLVDYPEVTKIADELSASPAQVLIAWGARRGYSVIPKSVNKDRIYANFEQIELSDEAYEKVSGIGAGKHHRFNIPVNYNPSWQVNIFDEEAEKGVEKRQRVV
ncbi:Aldo keto reductase [Vararia minispora EC-137]|uniref:Aldo keto reductase n=1 Tax=Vararia minispora EC-137 TaxID=1314806 RepID=A0ACB8QDW6_9AGAM|nr:Aldo keto reductase [Vararia minispora EC-137]